MNGIVPSRELLAGSAAAALLLVTLAIGFTPWLAIPLAVATYAGIAWLWRLEKHDGATGKPLRRRFALERMMSSFVATHMLLSAIESPSSREQVQRISERMEQIMMVIAEDRNLAAATIYNDHVLVPVRMLLTEYHRLSVRDVNSARELLEQTESHALPLIEQAIDSFYERLHRSHVADLATLGELLEINLESLSTMSSRRFTS